MMGIVFGNIVRWNGRSVKIVSRKQGTFSDHGYGRRQWNTINFSILKTKGSRQLGVVEMSVTRN